MFKYLQAQVQPGMLLLMMGAIISLALLAGYLYGFKQALKDYTQAGQTVALLQNEISTGVSLQDQLKSTQQNVQALEQQLNGLLPVLPVNQKIAYVIGQLGAISARHQVSLNTLKPGNIMPVVMFQELPFDIEVSGDYFNVFAWLEQIEQDLAPILVKDFVLYSRQPNDKISMKLTLVSYISAAQDSP